jgi:hypothetical protein
MAPTDNSKWAVLRELALARFLEDAEVADAMRRAEELAIQQPGDPAVFVAGRQWRSRWPTRRRGSARRC